ncbi:MAG: SEC-C metal-binding domain-containing protein, partial [Psittacicella sp.]
LFVKSIYPEVFEKLLDSYIPPQSLEEMWDIEGLMNTLINDFNLNIPISQWLLEDENLHEEQLKEHIISVVNDTYTEKEDLIGNEIFNEIEKEIMLQQIDSLWKDHLVAMDYLRKTIHLRSYAQVDPKNEYKKESYNMFMELLQSFKYHTVATLFKIDIKIPTPEEQKNLETLEKAKSSNTNVVGRNDPCPCGSGKKYKACHGKIAPLSQTKAKSHEPKNDLLQAQSIKDILPDDTNPPSFVLDKEEYVGIGRNNPCPCGSGKKYKACHGKITN